MTRGRAAWLALAYAALVAHLLFIPYAYAPLGLADAAARFSHVAWERLGSDQNIALVSRSLMFVPLGLLLAIAIARATSPRAVRVAAFVVASIVGCAVAVAINFAQVWFPSRTINLNNVAFESIGVIAGALAWTGAGDVVARWWRQLARGGRFGWRALLGGYVALYAFVSLSPFDFVTNGREFAEKLHSGLFALWALPGGCGAAPCGLRFLVAMAAAVPCGWWFAGRRARSGAGASWPAAAAFAVGVSAAIELLHLLMVSGVSQGGSFAFRAAGLFAGAAAYPLRTWIASVGIDRFARPLVLAALAPYLLAVAYVGGWTRSGYVGLAGFGERLGKVVWMPFFYEYYAPYAETMQSAVVHTALYACVGVGCWLWARNRAKAPLAVAGTLAGLLALAVETSKLLLAARTPDYTDVIVAVVAAMVALAALRAVSRGGLRARESGAGPSGPRDGGRADVPAAVARGAGEEVAPAVAGDRSSAIRDGTPVRELHDAGPARTAVGRGTPVGVGIRIAGAAMLAIAVWTVVDFPLWRVPLAVGLLAYALLLVRLPLAYLIAVPALLPVFDLAPYTGRFFWDEFDVLLAVTLGVRMLVNPAPRPARRTRGGNRLMKVGVTLLYVSVAISTLIGLFPLQPLDANAFSNYLSNYNALRVAKGYAWAGIVYWLIARDAAADSRAGRLLSLGLFGALVTAVGSVFWERLEFLGAGPLDASFRAAGMVSALHVGGAYLEAMLVMLAPVGLAIAVGRERPWVRVFAYVVVALDAVAVLLTISRAAFAGWVVAVLTFAVVWWRATRGGLGGQNNVPARGGARRRNSARSAFALGFAGLAALAGVLSQSAYLRERLAIAVPDAEFRWAHWKESLALMQTDPFHLAFGMGLGSYPREFYFAYAERHRLPAYQVEQQRGSEPARLLLSGGDGMYVDQRIVGAVGKLMLVRGLVRSADADAALEVQLCEKSLLNSIACTGGAVRGGRDWRPFELALRRQGAVRSDAQGPLALSLSDASFGSRVEVARLALFDGRRDVLRNGSFQCGMDDWFLTSDVHSAWRALNSPIQVFIEQGSAGVLGLAFVLMALLTRGKSAATIGGRTASVAGIAALCVVGSFDSLLDFPRLPLLVVLASWLGVLVGRAGSARPECIVSENFP